MMKTVAVTIAAAALTMVVGCGSLPYRAAENFTLDLPWDDYQQLVVRTCNGHVTLRAEASESLRISGEKQARGLTLQEANDNLAQLIVVAEPDVSDASIMRIELLVPDALRKKSPGASFDILVPKSCRADIDTKNGYIRVGKINGPSRLKTSNGRIFAQQVAGSLEADSSNGRIHAVFIEGDLVADTSNGRIIVDTIDGDCRLDTSNGNIEARKVAGSVWATSSNGRLTVDATPGPEGQIVLKTSNGKIVADVPANFSGLLDLHTSNGRIITNLDGATLTDPRWSKHSIEARMNGGGSGRVSARTSNGSITLNCR